MSFSEDSLELLIRNESKEIFGDIHWETDKNHRGSYIFSAEIESTPSYPLSIKGTHNPKRGTLTFSMLLKPYGSIYRLDMGVNHRNPGTKRKVGRVHKHKWTDRYEGTDWAYCPEDITEPLSNVLGVWRQFCLESKTKHRGKMLGLPSGLQTNLF